MQEDYNISFQSCFFYLHYDHDLFTPPSLDVSKRGDRKKTFVQTMYVLVPKNDTHNCIDVLRSVRARPSPGLTQYGHSYLNEK